MSVQGQTPVLPSEGGAGRTELIDGLLTEVREIGESVILPSEMDLVNDIEMFIAWMYDHSMLILEGKETHYCPQELADIGERLVKIVGSGAVSAMAAASASEAKSKFDEIQKRGGRYEGHNTGNAHCRSGSIPDA